MHPNAPRPVTPPKAILLCRIKEGSGYADRPGESYHLSSSTPNHRKVQKGAFLVFDQRDESGWSVLGYGVMDHIERVKTRRRTKWGAATDIHAFLANWTSFDPPLCVSPSLAAAIKSLPGFNAQLAIREITADIFSRMTRSG